MDAAWKYEQNKTKKIKQLKMCDPQIFSAFMHRNEPPI